MITQVQSVDAFAKMSPYLVEKPRPIIGAETIQLIVMREILDYTVLRTEDTRELNAVHTPLSIEKLAEPVRRVAFLGPKQKAAESRDLERMLRTALRSAGLAFVRRNGVSTLVREPQEGQEVVTCYLKDNLCMACPRCGLHGATSTTSGQAERANIKHRIEYSTAFSLLPFDDIATSITFNAINDRNQITGQALGQRFAVQPATLFPSVITLKSVTQRELILTVKTLLACKSYGAEGRVGGDVRNTIWGVAAGWEEVITSLELTLELASKLDELKPEIVTEITKKYKGMAGNASKVVVLETGEVDNLIEACARVELDGDFLERAYGDVAQYRAEQLAR